MSTNVVDKNLVTQTQLDLQDAAFYPLPCAPFSIHGVAYIDGKFRRMPEAVAASVSEKVHSLHSYTAGGRLRFYTDSEYVAIRAWMPRMYKIPRAAFTGTCGFDLYVGAKPVHTGTFPPPVDIEDYYESVVHLGSRQKRLITIHFPQYAEVSALQVGLQADARVLPPPAYKFPKPMVFYGSSITQGACASRPGGSYQAILSRKFGFDYVNLGFSGSARAEDAMIDYLAALDMSAFVLDYDHNAPTPEHLQATHKKLFQAVRKTHPDIPILMMSRPRFKLKNTEPQRLQIVKQTYLDALAAGDDKVFFISGLDLMRFVGDNGLVDMVHPNDAGFFSMAKAMEKPIRAMLKLIK